MATTSKVDDRLEVLLRRSRKDSRIRDRVPRVILYSLISLGLVEWFFSPVEKLLGEFMSWTRNIRPETGQGWELNRENEKVSKKLESILEESQQRKAAGTLVGDWSAIPAILDSVRSFVVPAAKFIQLYEKLPPILQVRVIPTSELLKNRLEGRWQRVFFVAERDLYRFYFVDSQNLVITQGYLNRAFFDKWQLISRPTSGTLDQFDDFLGRAFPTDVFFQSIEPIGPISLTDFDPAWIGQLEGTVNRVAVGILSDDGLRTIGFEVTRPEGPVVYRYLISEGIGNQLFREMMDRTLSSMRYR